MLPWWIREGLAGDYGLLPGDLGIQGIGYRNRPTGSIRLPRLPWPDGAVGDLIPLREFFHHFPDGTAGVSEMRLWHAQAGLLVRWALFGPELRAERTRALWALAEVARYRPITEEDFQTAFGLCFTEAEQELARFRETARWDAPWIRVPGFERDLPEFGEFSLRRATEAEVARLRGNFERVEMGRWRATAPELAAKYEAAARRTLKRGLRFASDDARVHAVYGLLEYETGHPTEARPHLEYAFAHGAAGGRALLALARVRLADLSVGLAAGDRLPEEVPERVLTPLFAAKDLRPALAEVYHCIGEVWERSAVAPRRGHLAVLAEGVALFSGRRRIATASRALAPSLRIRARGRSAGRRRRASCRHGGGAGEVCPMARTRAGGANSALSNRLVRWREISPVARPLSPSPARRFSPLAERFAPAAPKDAQPSPIGAHLCTQLGVERRGLPS